MFKRNIQVGDGATIVVGSDRYPATVIEVSDSQRVVALQRDHYKRVDNNGMSEDQTYEFSRDERGMVSIFSYREKTKDFVQKGSSAKNGIRAYIGSRNAYYDFSF